MCNVAGFEVAVVLKLNNCSFYSNSQVLVQMVQLDRGDNLQAADWHSYSELMRIRNLLRAFQEFECCYLPSEENSKAHILANTARLWQFSYRLILSSFKKPPYVDLEGMYVHICSLGILVRMSCCN